MPSAVAELAFEDIVVHGYVADLDDVFGRCRVSIAPLRYGAGQKGKIVTSLSYGVPVIATSVAVEGMHFRGESVVKVGDTPESFAQAIADVYLDEAKWQFASDGGLMHVTTHFGYDVGKQAIQDMMAKMLVTDATVVSTFLGAIKVIFEEENKTGHFPPLLTFSKPIALRLAAAARNLVEPHSGSALDLLIKSMEYYDYGFLKVAAAHVALQEGRREVALALAEAAMGQMQGDLYAEEIWLHSKSADGNGTDLSAIDKDLKGRFCERPFRWMEFGNTAIWSCCPAWLPIPIGPANAPPEEIWNGPVAVELRRSILDGSFRYCSRVNCPKITNKTLPRREHVALDQFVPVMSPPTYLNLCYDNSCNLSCPSCRKRAYVADKHQQDVLEDFYKTAVAPVLRTARTVNITGSGDPFASHHFRHLLSQIGRSNGPRIDIQTNGVLFDERAWSELLLEGRIRRIWVSLDAATKPTYDRVRRNGDFGRAKINVRNLVKRRRAQRIDFIGIDFVVQNSNIREMLDFISLGLELGVDSVRFNMIRNWGTFSTDEFARHFVGSNRHPNYSELLTIIDDPLFSHPIVDPGNLWRFTNIHREPARHMDRDVLHT